MTGEQACCTYAYCELHSAMLLLVQCFLPFHQIHMAHENKLPTYSSAIESLRM